MLIAFFDLEVISESKEQVPETFLMNNWSCKTDYILLRAYCTENSLSKVIFCLEDYLVKI